jgi:lipoprotein-releasing system permease protein
VKSYVPFLSLRYLWFHKVSSGLGILGVTLGVGLVVVVVGVMDGFQARLKRSLIGNAAAVVVRPMYHVDAEALVRELKARIPGVVEVAPTVQGYTFVESEGRGSRDSVPCVVVGIDPARERVVSDLDSKLHAEGRKVGPGGHPHPLRLLESASLEEPFRVPEDEAARNVRLRPAKQGIVVSQGVARKLRAYPGKRLRMYMGRPDEGEGEGGAVRSVRVEAELFTVTGIYESGDSEMDQRLVLMDRRDALSYFGDQMPLEGADFRLLLDDEARADEVKFRILDGQDALAEASRKPGTDVGASPFEVQTWRDMFSNLLAAVDNERGLLIVITSFSFVVVAFLIGSTQSMLVVEKTREIGVLRSLGASVGGTSAVFLGNGLFIGALGAAAGAGLGLAVTGNIQAIARFIRESTGRDLFPANIYRFNEIPINVTPEFLLTICGGAVVFALLGSLLPAVRAALLDPVESLHHE